MPAFEQEAGSAMTSTANMACRVGPARDAQVCLCAEIPVTGESGVLSRSMFLFPGSFLVFQCLQSVEPIDASSAELNL